MTPSQKQFSTEKGFLGRLIKVQFTEEEITSVVDAFRLQSLKGL